MKKRILCITLTLLMLLPLLVACNTGDGTGGKTPSTVSTDVDDLDYVELIWHISGKKYRDSDMVVEKLNEYLVEKLNTKIDLIFTETADYLTKMSTIIGAGEKFDICAVATATVNPVVNAQSGAFVELDDLLPVYAPDLLNEVPAWVIDGAKINGHIYVIPSYKDVANSFAFIWNKTLSDDLGLDLSESWKTIHDLLPRFYEYKEARDAKYPEKTDIPMMTAYRTMGAWLPCDIFIGAAVANVENVEFFKGKGKGELVFNMYETDEYREFARIQKQLVDDGIVAYDSKNYDPDGVRNRSGETAIRIGNGMVAMNDYYYSDDWNAALVVGDYTISSTAYLFAAGTAISVTSSNPERAVMVQNLVYSDQFVATTMRLGLEGDGLHYVLDENGFADLTKGLNADPADRGFYRWYGAESGNLFKSILPNSQPANLFEAIMAVNDNAVNFPTNLGFVLKQDAVANEIAAVANVIEEYHTPLSYAMVDNVDAHVDEFVAKLKANGVDKIIEEAQKQLNDWRASVGKEVLK